MSYCSMKTKRTMFIVEKLLLCNLYVNCPYCISYANKAFDGELYKLMGLGFTLNFYLVRAWTEFGFKKWGG